MEVLPTLLGALPDLGVVGSFLVVMLVGRRMLEQERAYFTAERTTYRTEATEDRTALRLELAEVKAERDQLQDRLRAVLAEQWAEPPTERLPTVPR